MDKLHHILGRAEAVTPSQIEELETAIVQFSTLFQKDLKTHVNGQLRTKGINTPKAHKMMFHALDFVKWWGLSGLINEQGMENFHQLYKFYFPLVQHLHGGRKILTLESRLANKNLLLPS